MLGGSKALRRLLISAAPRPVNARQECRPFHSTSWRREQATAVDTDLYTPSIEQSADLKKDAGLVNVTIKGKEYSFNPIFLRDACQCSKCVDSSTQQKLFQTSDIPHNVRVTVRSTPNDQSLRLSWTEDHPSVGEEHVTELPIQWLQEAHARAERLKFRQIQQSKSSTWDRRRMQEDNLWVDYPEYAVSDSALLRALRQLKTHGLVFLRNVPDDETSVISIAERIGPLRDSFYGRTWDVRSVPDAKNIAYTHQYLGLHMDLLYMTNPPHLQFLHSLRAQAPGGESLFSDSFHAAELMREQAPYKFYTLARFPVTYHYMNASQYYKTSRPTIELDLAGIVGGQGGIEPHKATFFKRYWGEVPARTPNLDSEISRINWSPPFQGPFQHELDQLPAYRSAAQMFSELVNADENVFEYRLAEGECVIFDNRRVLHARKAFDISAGERWLKGAYVDDDVYWSRLRVLEEAAAKA